MRAATCCLPEHRALKRRSKFVHTEYILELYDTSGEHKPIARFQSSTLFMVVNIGDRFDDIGWPAAGRTHGALATRGKNCGYPALKSRLSVYQ